MEQDQQPSKEKGKERYNHPSHDNETRTDELNVSDFTGSSSRCTGPAVAYCDRPISFHRAGSKSPGKCEDSQPLVMTRIARLQEELRDQWSRYNALSPVSHLPAEILCEVFAYYRDECYYLERGTPAEKNRWIRVSHVCRRWRDVALRFPGLWNVFTLFPHTRPDVVPFQMLMVERSSSHDSVLSIDVDLYWTPRALSEDTSLNRAMIRAMLPRIRALRVRGSSQYVEEFLSYFAGPCSAEVLEHIFISCTRLVVPLDIFGLGAPCLRSLHLDNWERFPFNSALLRSRSGCLTHLEISEIYDQPWPELFGLIRASGATLRKLAIREVLSPPPVSKSGGHVPLPILHLSQLEYLEMKEPAAVVCHFVEHLRIPVSTRLHLSSIGCCPIDGLDIMNRLSSALCTARRSDFILSPRILCIQSRSTDTVVSGWVDWPQATDNRPLPLFTLTSEYYEYIQEKETKETDVLFASLEKQIHIPGIPLSNVQWLLLPSHQRIMEDNIWEAISHLPNVSRLSVSDSIGIQLLKYLHHDSLAIEANSQALHLHSSLPSGASTSSRPRSSLDRRFPALKSLIFDGGLPEFNDAPRWRDDRSMSSFVEQIDILEGNLGLRLGLGEGLEELSFIQWVDIPDEHVEILSQFVPQVTVDPYGGSRF